MEKNWCFLPLGADIKVTTPSDDVTSVTTKNDFYLFLLYEVLRMAAAASGVFCLSWNT